MNIGDKPCGMIAFNLVQLELHKKWHEHAGVGSKIITAPHEHYSSGDLAPFEGSTCQ